MYPTRVIAPEFLHHICVAAAKLQIYCNSCFVGSQQPKMCGFLSSSSNFVLSFPSCDTVDAVQDRPFKCSQCPSAFSRKPYLDIHMRVTLKVLSPEAFSWNDFFPIFLKTHTGERPFQCEICLKRLIEFSGLPTMSWSFSLLIFQGSAKSRL